MNEAILIYVSNGETIQIPVYDNTVHCGDPSDVGDIVCDSVDVMELLASHTDSTFIFRLTGESMDLRGFHAGDNAVVDSSLTPQDGDAVVVRCGNDFSVKTYFVDTDNDDIIFIPESSSKSYKPFRQSEMNDLQVVGVVTSVVHPVERTHTNQLRRLVGELAPLPTVEEREENKAPLHSLISDDVDAQQLIRRLHELLDDKRGKDFAKVIQVACEMNFFTERPTYAQLHAIFPYMGRSSGYYRYLNFDFTENEKVVIFNLLSSLKK